MKKISCIIISMLFIFQAYSQKITEEAKKIIEGDNYMILSQSISKKYVSPVSKNAEPKSKGDPAYSFVVMEKKPYRIYLIAGTQPCDGELKVVDNFNNIVVSPIKVNADKKYAYADIVLEARTICKCIIKNTSKNSGQSELLAALAISKNEDVKIVKAPVLKDEAMDTTVFNLVDEMPQFIKGDETAFPKWVAQNLKYPESAKNKGIQGKAFVQFVVDKEGNVRNIRVLKGLDPNIDAYLLEFFKTCPTWQKPGKMGNKPVNVSLTMPVQLKLN